MVVHDTRPAPGPRPDRLSATPSALSATPRAVPRRLAAADAGRTAPVAAPATGAATAPSVAPWTADLPPVLAALRCPEPHRAPPHGRAHDAAEDVLACVHRASRGDRPVVELRVLTAGGGRVLDVSDVYADLVAREVDSAVRASVVHRGQIEQAKGMVVAELGLDEDAAFALLRRLSNESNVKLRDVARRIVDARACGPVVMALRGSDPAA